MLTKTEADETPNTKHQTPRLCGHEGIATTLLRDMFDKNLRLAPRMLDIGDFKSAEMILQSAITQVRQIASYQTPNPKHQTPNTRRQTPNTKHQEAIEV